MVPCALQVQGSPGFQPPLFKILELLDTSTVGWHALPHHHSSACDINNALLSVDRRCHGTTLARTVSVRTVAYRRDRPVLARYRFLVSCRLLSPAEPDIWLFV